MRERFPLLDSLRAVAALSVFAYHVAFSLGDFSADLGPYLRQLNIGVPIFFLLSGFLLYRPFAAARMAGKPAPPLIPYAIRRALRIVPAYWLALPLIALWLGDSRLWSAEGIPVYFGFLQLYDGPLFSGGIAQAWTLDVEVTFYAALPLIALAIRRLPVRGVRSFLASEFALAGVLIAIAVAWQYGAFRALGAGDPALFRVQSTLLGQLDHFALGMALASVTVALAASGARPRAVRLIESASWLPWLAAAILFVVVSRGVHPPGFGDFGDQLTEHELRGLIALLLLLPATIGHERRDPVRRLLAARWLAWIGLISYAFYLWHLAILSKLYDAGVSDTLGAFGYAVVGLSATTAVAAASWYGLERHALKLAGKRPATASRRA